MHTIPIMFLLIICFLPLSFAQILLLCDDTCAIEKELDLTEDTGDIQFEACAGHLVKFQFRPDSDVNVDLSLEDSGRIIYVTDSLKKSEDVEVYSLTNNGRLQYNFPLHIPLSTTPTTPHTTNEQEKTTPTTTTEGPTTVSPDTVCDSMCAAEDTGDDMVNKPFPGLNSCCEDGGLYCWCYSGQGGSSKCASGLGFCKTECVEISTCEAETCCPEPNVFQYVDNSERRMSIRYSCQANREENAVFEYGSDEVIEPLEQNTVLTYELSSEHLHKVDVNLSLTTPIAG